MALFGTAAVMASSVGLVWLSATPAIAAPATTVATTSGTDVESALSNVISADAIASGYITSGTDATNAANVLSGAAWVVDKGTPAVIANGLTAVPEGTTVYMQWYDSDGAVSPIYSTVTHDNIDTNGDGDAAGSYAFDLRGGWTDANGTNHTYKAVNGQYYKLWIQDYTTASGNTATMFRQAGGFFPGSFVNSVTGNNIGQFPLIGTNMQKTGIYMYVRPEGDYRTTDQSAWKHDTEGPLSAPSVSLSARNSVSGKVWLETGSGDYANSGTGPNDNANDPQASGYTVVMSTLTDDGAAAYKAQVESLPEAERSDAAKTLLTDHPEYISQTVYGETDADGKYTLRFDDLNDQYIYGYVMDPQGNIVNTYSSYTSPEFRTPNYDLSWTPQTAPAQNLVQRPMWYNVNFAIVPDTQVNLDITNYDVTANPATIGDTAELDLTGVALSPLDNKIVWTDSSGNVLKTCDGLTSLTDAEACTFTVPEGTADGEIIRATLYAGDNAISADSFVVQVPSTTSEIDASKYTPAYEDTTVTAGETGTVPAPTFTDADGNTVSVDGESYASGNNVPAGFTVNSDGTITVADTVAVGTYDIPVIVTYADGSSETVYAHVTVTAAQVDQNTTNEPVYSDGTTVEQGGSATIEAPKNADGTTLPDGTKYTGGQDIPNWATVNPDGSITVTPGTDVTPGDYTVPVTVTYPDGTTDTVDVPIKVTEKPAAPSQADQNEPTAKDQTVKVGETPKAEDSIGNLKDLPDGTKVEFKTPVDTSTPGTKDATVVVTYPDGSTDEVAVKVIVEEAAAPVTNPDYNNGEAKPGETITIPNTGGDVQPGTTVEVEVPGKAEINDKGELVVTPSEDAKPGDKVVVEVKDGSGKVIDTVEVVVTEPGAETPTDKPSYDNGTTKPGETITIPNKGGAMQPGTTVEVEGPGKAEINDKGELVITPNEDAKPGDKIIATVKDADGNVIDTAEVTISGDEAPVDNGEQPAPVDNGGSTDVAPAPVDNGGNAGGGAVVDNGSAVQQPAQQDSGSLAYTGAAGVGVLAGAGILALVAGGILVAARRRKNA